MEELLLKIIRTLPSNEARAKLLQIYIQEYGAISNEIGVEIRKIMRKESRMIAIPNMEKPSCCGLCQLCLNDSRIANGYCMFFHRTVNMMELDKACPLIEIDLVRCEECTRSGTDGVNTFCMWLGALRKPTDFCSYGERRADERTTE